MLKRAIDIIFSVAVIIIFFPFIVLVGIGIRLSSRGPVIYKARRVGRDGREFVMHKFRTMHVEQRPGASRITGIEDPRIYPLGAILRRMKIDELPQLFDILKGSMSVVGPRPEDPEIVEKYYKDWHKETLRVRPGLTSPGSIHYYSHGEKILVGEDIEGVYVERLLDTKMALDLVYVRNISLLYDMKLIFRTIYVLLNKAMGRREFPLPPEVERVNELNIRDFGAIYWGG